jgi:hypothetical protein
MEKKYSEQIDLNISVKAVEKAHSFVLVSFTQRN